MQFFLSVVAGIVSSILVSLFIWLFNRFWRARYYSDVARVYKNKIKGYEAINSDIKNSKSVKILAVRGQSLIARDLLPNLWDTDNSNRNIVITISDPANLKIIEERSVANNTSADAYKKEMEAVNEELCNNKRHIFNNLSVYFHTEDLSFKLFILDDCLYVLYYQKNKNVNKSHIVKYNSDTGAYDAFVHYYNSISSKSKRAWKD